MCIRDRSKSGVRDAVRGRSFSRHEFNEPICDVFPNNGFGLRSDRKRQKVFHFVPDLFIQVPVHGRVRSELSLETRAQVLGLHLQASQDLTESSSNGYEVGASSLPTPKVYGKGYFRPIRPLLGPRRVPNSVSGRLSLIHI